MIIYDITYRVLFPVPMNQGAVATEAGLIDAMNHIGGHQVLQVNRMDVSAMKEFELPETQTPRAFFMQGADAKQYPGFIEYTDRPKRWDGTGYPNVEEVIQTRLDRITGDVLRNTWVDIKVMALVERDDGLSMLVCVFNEHGQEDALYGVMFTGYADHYRPKTTYNHAYDMAFSRSGSTCEEGSDLTPALARELIKQRLDDLSDAELMEAIGAPFNSHEE